MELSFDFGRGHRFVPDGAYVGVLDDYMVSLRVELCVDAFAGKLVGHLSNPVTISVALLGSGL